MNISSERECFLGGDGPEAVTPALYAAVHTLSWRKNAVKIALLIADAPPHGLDRNGDTWPQGSIKFLPYCRLFIRFFCR